MVGHSKEADLVRQQMAVRIDGYVSNTEHARDKYAPPTPLSALPIRIR
jgi:hypothetical protein